MTTVGVKSGEGRYRPEEDGCDGCNDDATTHVFAGPKSFFLCDSCCDALWHKLLVDYIESGRSKELYKGRTP